MEGEHRLEIERKVLLDRISGLYGVAEITLLKKQYYAAASENRNGPVFLIDQLDDQVFPLEGGAGGVMNLVDVPGENAMLSIEGFYPVFDSAAAVIEKIGLNRENDQILTKRRVLTPAPYVHRIGMLHEADGLFLAAGILCAKKDFQEDWSSAGSLQIGRYSPDEEFSFETVHHGIFKHHAMQTVSNREGFDELYFGGTEGCFKVTRKAGQWICEQVLDIPTSEIVVYDLDGDGERELAVIEGFHGNNVAVFRNINGRYERVLDLPIQFGHVLWGGDILARPGLISSSRDGDKALYLYRLKRGAGTTMELSERIAIDQGQAASQILVCQRTGSIQVIAANHGAGQLVRYTLH